MYRCTYVHTLFELYLIFELYLYIVIYSMQCIGYLIYNATDMYTSGITNLFVTFKCRCFELRIFVCSATGPQCRLDMEAFGRMAVNMLGARQPLAFLRIEDHGTLQKALVRKPERACSSTGPFFVFWCSGNRFVPMGFQISCVF